MSAKRPPAKAKIVGATWWGKRWIEALERSSRDVVARLGRGRAYARDGHVYDLHIHPGKVSALVSDDELESFRVTFKLELFSASTWQQIMRVMSEQALFAAQLLNGEMPSDIDKLFKGCGKSLFPANSHDIDADCSCDDWSSPCKHVAAVHYVLGEALDRDPFLLFELRGRTQEQVLAGLNQLRSHTLGDVAKVVELQAAPSNAVALQALSPRHFERGQVELPLLSFSFDTQVDCAALLRSLGKPPSWNIAESPQDLLGPMLLHARQLACDLAVGNEMLPTLKTMVGKAHLKSRKHKAALKTPR